MAVEPVNLDGTSWIYSYKRSGTVFIYAGYHADEPHSLKKHERMFLPMFNKHNNGDEWAAICDLKNLRDNEKGYCDAKGTI